MSVAFLQAALADGDPDDFGKVVEDEGWVSDGKYDITAVVILVTPEHSAEHDGQLEEGYYQCSTYRSGSYFSDYDYGEWDVFAVEPYEEVVTLTKWRNKS